MVAVENHTNNMDTFQIVITGIVSSLIATLLFLSFVWFAKNIVLPWYADKIYRGVRIDGRWDLDIGIVDNMASNHEATIELNQKGDKVTGIYSHKNKNKNHATTYRVRGEVRNTYLNTSIWPVSKSLLDTGTFVLRIFSHSGLRMKGVITFISTEDGTVKSREVEFVKNNS